MKNSIYKKRKHGFSLIEIVVVIAIMAIIAVLLVPVLLRYTENSRAQKDVTAMDEVVNAVQLALADPDCFDEMELYSCDNNFITYSDSSGKYGQQIIDAEYWAPDGYGRATTITFNPEKDSQGNTIYRLSNAIVNDMTYGNGSVAEKRQMQGAKISNNQCLLPNAKLAEGQESGYLYNRVRQTIGNSVITTSATYANSSFTIFIRFTQKDGVTVADVNGAFNGTNLDDSASASLGSGTNSETVNPETGEKEQGPATNSNGGTTNTNFSNSALAGGGSTLSGPGTKDYLYNDKAETSKNGTLSCAALGQYITTKKPKHIKFLTLKATEGDDVSVEQNGSVLAWIENDVCYIANTENNYKVAMGDKVEFRGDKYEGYYNVETIDVGVLDIKGCTDLSYVFAGFGKEVTTHVAIYGLDKWDTSNILSYESAFSSFARKAKSFELDASVLNTSKAKSMQSMFYYCGLAATNFNVGNLGNWDTKNVQNMQCMFTNAGRNSKTWYVGDLGKWNTSNVNDMGYMFNGASYYANNTDIGDLSNWDTSKVTTMIAMFYNYRSYSKDDFCTIKGIRNWDTSNVETMHAIFDGFGMLSKRVELDIRGWDTSSVTSMSFAFTAVGASSESVTILGLDNLNTSKVTRMFKTFSYLGQYSQNVNIGNLSQWDVSSVIYMNKMFEGSNVSAIGDISNWNVSNVKSMRGMFASSNCINIGDISKWNTSSVRDMAFMFSDSKFANTTSLSLSSWNISNVSRYTQFQLATGKLTAPTWILPLAENDSNYEVDEDEDGLLIKNYF